MVPIEAYGVSRHVRGGHADPARGSYFEYLLGRFTEPNEVFGPVDLRRLREGVVEVETAGVLSEADVAFLDEVFRGSTKGAGHLPDLFVVPGQGMGGEVSPGVMMAPVDMRV